MKTLFVGDPHLELKRLEDCRGFINKLKELSQEHDRVVLLGDLFHTFAVIRSEILALWNDYFLEFADLRKVIALVGNHDYASQTGGNHALEVFNGLADIVQSPFIDVTGVHYMPFYREIDEFEALCRNIPAGRVLVCHQSFNGAAFSSGFQDPHGADPDCVKHLSRVISGHIHTRQVIANVWYPGTPYQTNFGEAGEVKRTFTVMLRADGYEVSQEHDMGMPQFHIIQANTTLGDLGVYIPENPKPCDSYKIIGNGTPAEIAAFWSNPEIKVFRSKVRRVVDGLVPDRGSVVLPDFIGKTKKEKLDAFIESKNWRTEHERLSELASSILFD